MNSNFKDLNIAIVGLGLMGASLCKSLRVLNPKNIFGIDCDENIIKTAKSENVIDNKFESIEDILKLSDIIILCIYPEEEIKFIKKYQNIFKDNVILTDVSGLKCNLINKIENILNENINFITGHPMTGKEKNGYENSSKDLYLNCNYVLIPVKNSKESFNLLCEIIYSIGAKKIIVSSKEEHDSYIGYTSHLPHLLAVALCMDESFKSSKDFVGRSFKDVSRVANINEYLWSELFMENSENVLRSIENFKTNLDILEETIKDKNINSLKSLLKNSRMRKEEVEL